MRKQLSGEYLTYRGSSQQKDQEIYMMSFVIGIIHNVSKIGSVKMKEMGHVVCM